VHSKIRLNPTKRWCKYYVTIVIRVKQIQLTAVQHQKWFKITEDNHHCYHIRPTGCTVKWNGKYLIENQITVTVSETLSQDPIMPKPVNNNTSSSAGPVIETDNRGSVAPVHELQSFDCCWQGSCMSICYCTPDRGEVSFRLHWTCRETPPTSGNFWRVEILWSYPATRPKVCCALLAWHSQCLVACKFLSAW